MIPMKLPDIVDRLTICIIKHIRTGESQSDEIIEYLNELSGIEKDNNNFIMPDLIELLGINTKQWDLEMDIRSSKLTELEDIGRLACMVRDNNKLRSSCRNRLVDKTGQGYKDIKINYGV
jgi:hypothetical protein